LGITRAEQIEYLNLNPDNEAVQYPIASQIWQPILQDAIAKRRQLESFSVNGIEDLQEKERLFEEAEQAIDRLRFVGDYLIGRALADAGKTSDLTTGELMVVSQQIEQELAGTATAEQTREITALKAGAKRMLNLGNPANQPPRRPFHWLLEFPEVFLEGETKGFSAVIGNPPFLGRSFISANLGDDYLLYLLSTFPNSNGNADLCSHFLRKASLLLGDHSFMGMITTNSISQGATRENGLDFLLQNQHKIIRATKSTQWIGAANVFVSLVNLSKKNWLGEMFLDDQRVPGISSYLDILISSFSPDKLEINSDFIYRGSTLSGEGFVLTNSEKDELIEKDPDSVKVIKPFLTGQDINQKPNQNSERYAIDFEDFNWEQAKEYSACWERLHNTVRIQRQGNKIKQREIFWWQYVGRQEQLYAAIEGFSKILVCGQVSKYWSVSWVHPEQIFSDKVVVFALSDHSNFAVLSSCFHTEWAEKTSSRLKEDPNYNLANTFETFPFPISDPSGLSTQFSTLNTIGETYYTHRQTVMRERQEGLTKTYNRFHNASEMADDIQTLRELHSSMDQAVAAAYGWQDLDLGHGFHKTKQGDRFTISETARREVLDRLLELNHQRYAEEVDQGLHDKKGKSKKAKGKTNKKQPPKAELDDDQLNLL